MKLPSVRPGIVLTLLFLASACGDDGTNPVPRFIEVDELPDTAVVGSDVPVRVRVLDDRGSPVVAVRVTFNVVSGQGSVSESSITTTENGAAVTFWRLGPVGGVQELRVATAEVEETLQVTGTGGGIARISVLQSPPDEAPVGWPLDSPVRIAAYNRLDEPISGVAVKWTARHGSIGEADDTTRDDGTAAAEWLLGTEAGLQELQVELQDEKHHAQLAFAVQTFAGVRIIGEFPLAREGRELHQRFEPWGGVPPYSWSVARGTLPEGLSLSSDGLLSGTPGTAGDYPVVIQVSDSEQSSETLDGTLIVCDPSVQLSVGNAMHVAFPDPCGVVLPDTEGHIYRVGLMARGAVDDFSFAKAQLLLTARRVDNSAVDVFPMPLRTRTQRSNEVLRPGPIVGAHGVPDVRGVEYLNLDGGRFRKAPASAPARVLAESAALPERRTFTVVEWSEGTAQTVEAQLRMTSDHLAYYEDAGVAGEGGTTYDDTTLRRELDRFEAHAWPVIDSVFGNLGPDVVVSAFEDAEGNPIDVSARDVDGNGRILVLQLRPSLLGTSTGYVTPCDRLPPPERATDESFSCEQSNMAELLYVAHPGMYLMAHEARHLASHGWRLWDDRPRQPAFIEEGTAVLAAELVSRNASGVASGHRVSADQVYVDGPEPSWATYYLWAGPASAQMWLAAAPASGLVENPSPNPSGSSIYSSGWFFHRYLLDRFADGRPTPLLFELTAGGTGPDHIGQVLGVPWPTLLTDFMAAILVDDVDAARQATTNRFTSYDFGEILSAESRDQWASIREWLPFQEDVLFGTAKWELATWHTAPNLFQLTADGGGDLLLEVRESTESASDPDDGVVAVVVRVR